MELQERLVLKKLVEREEIAELERFVDLTDQRLR